MQEENTQVQEMDLKRPISVLATFKCFLKLLEQGMFQRAMKSKNGPDFGWIFLIFDKLSEIKKDI
ncbi:MAG: hypothetical protein WCN98_01670 [Verrucomicrobiaceae bacterium]